MAVSIKTYATNLAKSVRFASIDVFKEMMPNTTEFMETNNDLFKEVSNTIKNRRVIFNKVGDRYKQSKIYDTIDETKKSIFEDIKTGKLYNKDSIRQRRINKKSGLDSAFGFDGDGLDDSFNFDFDDNFEFDDENFGELADAIDDSNRTTSEMLANTIAGTSSNQIAANRVANQMTLLQMQEGFTTVNLNLGNIGNSITELGNNITSLSQTNAENSKTYYEKSVDLQSQMVSYLKRLTELKESEMGGKKSDKLSSNGPKTFGDVTSYEGIPNLASYANLLKNKLSDNLSIITSMNSLAGENTNMSMQFAMSPLAFLPKIVVKKVIGTAVQDSAKKLDNTLSSVFGSFISKMNEMADDAGFLDVKGMIGNFFGLNDSVKSIKSISTGYEKGNRSWNGKAEKALTEVIPTLLSKILAVQSNQNEITYNYDTGKFVTVKSLKEDFNNRYKNEIRNSFSDVRTGMDKMMQDINLDFKDQTTRDQFYKDYDRFFEFFFKSNQRFNPNKKNFEDYSGLGISKSSYDIIEALFNQLDPSVKMMMDTNKLKGRESWNNYVQNLTKNSPVYSILNNDASLIKTTETDTSVDKNNNAPGGSSLLSRSYDEKGHNIFWYLRTITETLLNGVQMIPSSSSSENDETNRSNNQYRTVETDYNNLPKKETKKTDEEYASEYEMRNRNRSALNAEYLINGLNENTTIEGVISNRVELARQTQSLEDDENNGGIINDLLKSKSIPDKIKALISKTRNAAKAPGNAISKLLDTANLRIYQLLYGNREYKGKNVDGIVDVMMMNIEDSFQKLNTFLDEKILTPLKNKLDELGGFKGILSKFGIDVDKIKEKLFGKDSLFGRTVSSVKEDAKSAWNYGKESVKSVYKEAYDKVNSINPNGKFGSIMDFIKADRKAKEEAEKESNTVSKLPTDEQNAVNKFAEDTGTDPAAITNARANNDIEGYDKGGTIRTTKIAMVHAGEEVITKEEKERRDREKMYSDRVKSYKDSLYQKSNGSFIGPLPKKEQEQVDFINSINDDSFSSIKEKLGDKFVAESSQELKDEVIDAIGHKKGDPTLMETMRDTAKSGFNKVFHTLFGIPEEDEEGNESKNNSRRKEAFNQILGNIKQYLPKGISGGLLGFAAGGLIGAPMLGAAIGSSLNIIKNSDKLQEYLFGDLDEKTNQRNGNGKLPKKLVDAMNKYGPDMKKYGITGAITTLLPFIPGGPVAGMIIGSGIGFAKNNAQVQDFLFGETGIAKGLKTATDKVKKSLPSMGIGAGLLALTGPFGLVGNVMLGAGMGFVSQTNKFQEFMFGKDDVDEDGNPIKVGGFLPMIRNRVIDPLKEFGSTLGDKFKSFVETEIKQPFHDAMSPFIEEFKNQGKRLFDSIKDTVSGAIDKMFEKTVGMPLTDFIEEHVVTPFTDVFKKLFRFLGTIIGGIVKFPTKIMSSAADSLRFKHLKEGNADYMTDEELARLKEKDPARYFMATDGQRFIENVKNGNLFNFLLGRKKIESEEDTDNTEKKSISEKFNEMMSNVSEKYENARNSITNKLSEWNDTQRNKLQNLKTQAYMSAGNIVGKLSDKIERGIAQNNNKESETKSENESEGDSIGHIDLRNYDRSKYASNKNKDNQTISPELQEMRDKYDRLVKEVALMQAGRTNNNQEDDLSENSPSNRKKKELYDDVKDIRNEVYGQLDGIGYNVHTIANILVERFGMPETEAKGAKVSRGNLRRQKWFEKMFGFILRPTKKIKDGLTSLLWGKKGNGGLLGTPMKIINSAINKITHIGSFIASGINGVINIVGTLGGIFKESISMIAPAIGEVFKGAMKLLTLPIDLLTGAISGMGRLLGGIAEGLGEFVGKTIELVGLIPTLIGKIGNLTIELGTVAFKISKAIVGGIFNATKSVVGGVAKFIGGMFGLGKNKNKERKYKFNGGRLDVLGKIESPVTIIEDKFEERHNKLLTFLGEKFDKLYELIPPKKENNDQNYINPNDQLDDNDSELPELDTNNDDIASLSNQVSLPTQYGVIRYDQDQSGELRPIQDSVYNDYVENKNTETERNTKLFNLLNTGDKDDDGSNSKNKKESWFSKIGSSIISALTGGSILKIIGAGLLAGALYDYTKNGENSFTGKLVSQLGVMLKDTLSTAADDIIPTLADFIVSAFDASQEKTLATTSDGNTIDKNGSVYDKDGNLVKKNKNASGWLGNLWYTSMDELSTSINKHLPTWLGGTGGKESYSITDYIKAQTKNISEFVNKNKISTEEYEKEFLPIINELYRYRKDTVGLDPLAPMHNERAYDYITNNTDIVEEYKKKKGITDTDDNNENTSGKGKYGRGNVFFSQNDPSWANMRYNSGIDTEKQTMADSGCGPTAAAMVSKRMNPLSGSNPVEAANYAVNNGFKEQNGGTRPEFFKSYFREKGIDSEVQTNLNSTKRQNIIDSLKNGNDVILMGKSNYMGDTPFGEEVPHYVSAIGVDGDDIIVNDPYSNRGAERYSLDETLNDSSISIRTNGKSGRGKKYGRGRKNKYGRAATLNMSIFNKSAQSVSNALDTTTGNLSSGTTSLNFVTDLGTTFTKVIGEMFGVDLTNSASGGSSFSGDASGAIQVGDGTQVDGTIAARVIDEFFSKSPKFSGKGATIVAIAKSACHDSAKGQNPGVDPFLLSAIMMQETGGNSNALNTKNNPGGVMKPGGGGQQTFNTLEDGIMAVAKIIHREWVVKGNNTISGLASVYAPAEAANDPTGLNGHWIPGVTKFYNQLMQAAIAAGAIISGSGGGTGALNGTANSKAQLVVNIAKSCIGKIKYVFGATDAAHGKADCSSFVQYVYKQAGISIGRNTNSQYTDPKVVKVSKTYNFQPQPGDIIFFKNTWNSGYTDGVSHVGICTGVGTKFIENNSGKGCVTESDFTSNYCKKHFLAICRHQECVDKNKFTSGNPNTEKTNNNKSIKKAAAKQKPKKSSAFTVYKTLNGKGKSDNIQKPNRSLNDKVSTKYSKYHDNNIYGYGKSDKYVPNVDYNPSSDSNNINDIIINDGFNNTKYGKGIMTKVRDTLIKAGNNAQNVIKDNFVKDLSNAKDTISNAVSKVKDKVDDVKKENEWNVHALQTVRNLNNIYHDSIKKKYQDMGIDVDQITMQNQQKKVAQQQAISNSKIEQSIINLSNTVTNIYNILTLISTTGIDIKNLTELIKLLSTSKSSNNQSQTNLLFAPNNNQPEGSKNGDIELINIMRSIVSKQQ